MSDVTALKKLVEKHEQLKHEIAKVIIGQDKVVENVLNAVFSGGHVLLIGVPGLAKTLLVHTVADALGLDLDRKSTRLNSSHVAISYAVFCLKKKKKYMI